MSVIFYCFLDTFGASGGLFGQPAQTQNAGLFGKSVGFGAPQASAAAPVFNFGASTGTSLFGQNNQQKVSSYFNILLPTIYYYGY